MYMYIYTTFKRGVRTVSRGGRREDDHSPHSAPWMSPAQGFQVCSPRSDTNTTTNKGYHRKLAKHSFTCRLCVTQTHSTPHIWTTPTGIRSHHLALINRCGSAGPGSAKKAALIWSHCMASYLITPRLCSYSTIPSSLCLISYCI